MNVIEPGSILVQNLCRVRDRIAATLQRCGRGPDEVKLVAVTKYVDVATTRLLIEAGQLDIGESRPQMLWEKAEALSDTQVRWHLIGHLQRNKVKRSLPCCDLIHSVDSIRLLKSIDAAAAEQRRSMDCLLEVNISGESAKHGLEPDTVPEVLDAVRELSAVRIVGLMGMSSLSGGDRQHRQQFESLRTLRDDLAQVDHPRIQLRELSMGMSRDFELAIESGATIVRVGSILFDGI